MAGDVWDSHGGILPQNQRILSPHTFEYTQHLVGLFYFTPLYSLFVSPANISSYIYYPVISEVIQ